MRKTRRGLIVAADALAADIDHAPLVVANPLQGQWLAVPRDVRLGDTPEGEPAIHWQVPRALDTYGIHRDWDRGGTANQAFWRFVDLADADDPERFVTFAQRFGTLGLWPFETPDGKKIFGVDYWVPSVTEGIRTPHRYETFESGDEYRRITREGLDNTLYEPVSEWRRWAAWLKATIEIAFALRSGRLGSRKQWETLDVDVPFSTSPVHQQRNLAWYIQGRIVGWSGLTPVFHWEADEPSVALQLGGEDAVYMPRSSFQTDWPPNTLYPALVAHLLAVITAGTPMAICSRCGKIHGRERKARFDQPVYCSDECRHEAIKVTKRKSMAQARQRRGRRPDK